MKQYLDTKEMNPEALLFFRLGDFYELFFDDALTASKELEITLTQRAAGLDEKIPMAGVPHHVAEQYISRLIQKGYKVAICDQVEDPKEAKGLVKREVTKIVTPGTFTDTDFLDKKSNNYLMGLSTKGRTLSICSCDYTTGEILITEEFFHDTNSMEIIIMRELTSLNPKECLLDGNDPQLDILKDIIEKNSLSRVTVLQEYSSKIKFDLGLNDQVLQLEKEHKLTNSNSLDLILDYLAVTQMDSLGHLKKIEYYHGQSYLLMNEHTKKNLELVESIQGRDQRNTLFYLLDHCMTPMGSRMLKKWMNQPLLNPKEIIKRQEVIHAFHEDLMTMDGIKESLQQVYDFDRLAVKISQESLSPREMNQLKISLKSIEKIKRQLESSSFTALNTLGKGIDPLTRLSVMIDERIIEDPPIQFQEERYIKEGFDENLDELFNRSEGGTQWLLDLEKNERERTGIKNLRIKYNKILGYFIEVTKGNLNLVPEDYIRKQTLVNSERFFTVDLKEREANILNSKDEAYRRQYEILSETRQLILNVLGDIQLLARQISNLDSLFGLSVAARKWNYTRPIFDNSGTIYIEEGRHPIVEARLKDESYVPNDVKLNETDRMIQVITGPNMSGKSTYMRQTALIVIMAQMGSYVPADSCTLTPVDQIFTRIGASDNLAQGESTFMVEMKEVSHILEFATRKSLILLDEVGRGTSTFDGLSIAWALVEYLANQLRAKTLFATHYHELTVLEDEFDSVYNLTISTEKRDGQMVFLRKIVPGFTNHSYGIEVARLAGVKEEITSRASVILKQLEDENFEVGKSIETSQVENQIPFEVEKVIDQIKNVDINDMTPIESMKFLYHLQSLLDED